VRRRESAIPLSFIAGAVLLAACTDIPTGSGDFLSFAFAPLPSPSVVAGDTLRDSTGAVAPLSITVFGFDGESIAGAAVRFIAIDRGIRVDSITGMVIGDSARVTPARILVRVGDLSGPIAIPVVFRPDTVVEANARDSLSYSLTDSTLNVSGGLGVRVLHRAIAADTAVASFRVTFQTDGPGGAALGRLVNDAGASSTVDTTDASGTAQRRIRLDVTRLTSPTDSIIVAASVRYRGAHIRGSPVRLVLKVKPR